MDLLLLMACQENDDGKVEEVLDSGANPNVKVRLLIPLSALKVMGACTQAPLLPWPHLLCPMTDWLQCAAPHGAAASTIAMTAPPWSFGAHLPLLSPYTMLPAGPGWPQRHGADHQG